MTVNLSAEFQAKRVRYIANTKKIGLVVLVSFIAMVAMLLLGLSDSVVFFAFVPFFLSIPVWVVMTFAIYRCPNCKTVPMANMGGSQKVDFNPFECRKCRAVLKELK